MSVILNFETFEPLSNDVLAMVQGITFSETDIERILVFAEKRGVQQRFDLIAGRPNFKPLIDQDEEETAKFLCKYWRHGYRNRLETYFLGFCLKKGVSYESAYRIVDEVTKRTNDEERQSRLGLVDYHYRTRSTVVLKGKSGLREIIGELQHEFKQRTKAN